MVNDLKDLLKENVAAPPPDSLDTSALIRAGRRRVRVRRGVTVGSTALLVAGVLVVTAVSWPHDSGHSGAVGEPPAPDAPALHLADAEQAVEGRDYQVLVSHTNENLDRDNGQYLLGVTSDSLVLLQDGPRSGQLRPRYALVDPATGNEDWLPDLRVGQTQTWPIELGADRLVLQGTNEASGLVAYIFDRDTRTWTTMVWPALPGATAAQLGPDDRLYVSVPATQGQPPPGGWPTAPDGEAEDADAEGDTYRLWSVSLTDSSDVRDEGLTIGSLAFTEHDMVWSDARNGDAGLIHVRDLGSGAEHSFDPDSGEKCNLLSFGATNDRVVLGQYCGTYADGVRDDRVQILSTSGEQVVTLQDSSIDGGLPSGGSTHVVSVTSYQEGSAGTYLYDLDSDRFWRLSKAFSKFGMGDGPLLDKQFSWTTPVNNGHGTLQRIGELQP